MEFKEMFKWKDFGVLIFKLNQKVFHLILQIT